MILNNANLSLPIYEPSDENLDRIYAKIANMRLTMDHETDSQGIKRLILSGGGLRGIQLRDTPEDRAFYRYVMTDYLNMVKTKIACGDMELDLDQLFNEECLYEGSESAGMFMWINDANQQALGIAGFKKN